jgi:hypothetical protein
VQHPRRFDYGDKHVVCAVLSLAIAAANGFAARTGERRRQMPDIHIIPSGDRWNVKQENGDVVSAHDTQAEAEKAGKDWTRANGGGEVFTHRDEGEFSRIRKGDQV